MHAAFDTARPPHPETSGAESSLLVPPESVRRILVCQLRQIGDVLLTTPSLELLARRYPGAEIHVFTEKKCLPMLQGNPHVHTIWPVDKKALPSLLHELIFYRRVAASGFDVTVDFQQLPRCRWVVGFSRARVRLSFPPPWYLRFLYTHWTKPKPAYAGAYKAGVLAPLGIRWQGERPRLYLNEEEHAAAHALLDSLHLAGKTFVTVDATHRQPTRRWPAAHFAALMDMAAEARPDLHFLLPYGPGEEDEVRALRELCRRKDRVVIPPDMLSLRLMAACISGRPCIWAIAPPPGTSRWLWIRRVSPSSAPPAGAGLFPRRSMRIFRARSSSTCPASTAIKTPARTASPVWSASPLIWSFPVSWPICNVAPRRDESDPARLCACQEDRRGIKYNDAETKCFFPTRSWRIQREGCGMPFGG